MAYGGSQVRGLKSELQLPAYTITVATQNPNHVCDLQHSSQQHQILSPLGEARDRTHNPVVPSQIHFPCAMTGIPRVTLKYYYETSY